MMLSVVVHLQSNLRWFLPEVLLLGSAPCYTAAWVVWRLLTAILPTRIYFYGDDILWSSYQRMVLFFSENVTGLKVYLYGEAEQMLRQRENVIYIANHQSSVDWVVTNMLAVRQGSLGHLRYILKDGLRYLPLYGFYFRQHGSVYVKRSGKFTRQTAVQQLKYLSKYNIPIWLVIFPEGTRFNPEHPDVIQKSKQFALDQGLSPFTQLLTPRIKALHLAVEQLNDYLDAIYDVTVAYSDTQDPNTGARTPGPGVAEMLAGDSRAIHILMNRIDIKDVPVEEGALRHWLHKQYEQKERLLNDFYSTDPEIGGKFPGQARLSPLGLPQTFPAALLWSSTFIGAMMFSQGRSVYWKFALAASVGGIAWMSIRQ